MKLRSLSLALAAVLMTVGWTPACGSAPAAEENLAGEGSTNEEEPFDEEATAEETVEPYEGPATGTPLPGRDTDAGEYVPPPMSDVDADTGCCIVTLSVPDLEGNEATARLVGDVPPLNAATGVALAHANGAWSAQVCLPRNVVGHYAFYFGEVLRDDAGTDASVPDFRHDPTAPFEEDPFGRTVNVFGPVASCEAIDASTGTALR